MSNDNSIKELNIDDPLYEAAVDEVIHIGKTSSSMLMESLSIGYVRASRLVDLLEEQGIIGPANGARPRKVLIATPVEPFSLKSVDLSLQTFRDQLDEVFRGIGALFNGIGIFILLILGIIITIAIFNALGALIAGASISTLLIILIIVVALK